MQQDDYIGNNGESYFYHDINFEEEIHYLAKDRINYRESQLTFKQAEPIDSESFIKHFREKYRLCWKEIYLKFMALTSKAEKCRKCRKWFQISDIAGCEHEVFELKGDPFLDQQNYRLYYLDFHEIDYEDIEVVSTNQFTEPEYDFLKKQFQVTDNIRIPQQDNPDKAFDHLELLVKKHKEAIEFVEPQSMNFDTKINQAYAEFMKTTADKVKNSKDLKKKGSQVTVDSRRSLKMMTSQELYTRDGGKVELKVEMFDDLLVRGPQAHR